VQQTPAPKPFFAPPPPTVSSAAMNKPAGGEFIATNQHGYFAKDTQKCFCTQALILSFSTAP
jgi:hypothetical protein